MADIYKDTRAPSRPNADLGRAEGFEARSETPSAPVAQRPFAQAAPSSSRTDVQPQNPAALTQANGPAPPASAPNLVSTKSINPPTSPAFAQVNSKPNSPAPAFVSRGLQPLSPAVPPPAPQSAPSKVTAITPPLKPQKPVNWKRLGVIGSLSVLGILICAGIIGVVWTLISPRQAVNSEFKTTVIPLGGLVSADSLSLLGTRSLTVNGALIANEAFIISPSKQPSNATRGQIYFDQTANTLSYFNGTSFIELKDGSSTSLVTSVGGQSGAIGLGQGLSASGGQISNTGVLSVQGQTGSVTFTAGNGIAISGTTFSNSGILNVTSSSSTITVTNDGSGNITIGGGGGGSGTVQSPGGTAGKIAKFTGVQTIADSLISETGGTIVISGNLDVTGALALGSPLTVGNGGTGTNSLAANGVIVGNGVSALTSITAGGVGLCLVSTAGAPAFSACPSAAGVSSLNGLTGTLTLANSSGAGTTITIDNASTSQKGIASFNSTNFTASSGAINTIQDINTTAAPTFGRLNVTSSQATNGMLLVNNTNAGASGNLLDLQTNSVSQMSVSPAGAMTLTGTINGQTISSTANFTGTLGVSGLTSLNGGASVTGTLTANTITPNAAMTMGATNQSLLLQGNALTTLTATNGASTTTVSFVTPTANVTYRLQTAAAGTYDICTTVGNCAGTGGGVTTLGGTVNRLAKFTAGQVIGDSILTDDGATVTIAGALSVNTLTPTSSLTVGATGQSYLLQGNASSTITASDGASKTTVSFATPTANVIYRFNTAAAGTYDICTTVGNCAGSGGGVTTIGGTSGRIAKFTGAQTIADSLLSESGTTITVNGTLAANTITPTAAMTVGATGQSFLLQGSATSTITATDSGNTTTLSFVAPTANVTYRLQTAAAGTYDICTSVNNCNYANVSLSNLTSVAINASLTPGSAGAIDVGSGALPFRDIYLAGSSATPGTNNFKLTGIATAARTITLPDASGTVCIDTNNCNYVSLQASSPGTAQTGNINVGGTIIAGTSLQSPLLNTADAISGSTSALTMRSGDLSGGASGSSGSITIRSGNASGAATNSGNITIDAGTATGTAGTISVGTANASAVNVGRTAAALSLQGTSSSTMTFQNGSFATSLSFQTPTANVTYRFPTTTAGSYDICTTSGNCAGTGGGVTTPGGTSGRIAKFTGSQTIADSLLSETGSTVTVDGNLNLAAGNLFQINGAQISSANLSNDANLAKLNLTQTFTGSTNSFKNASDSVDAFDIQNTSSQKLFTADTSGNQILLGSSSSLAGKLTFYNATNSNTISVVPAVATGARTITLPDESGTVCLQSSANCGFALSSGGTGYIQNQSVSDQTADFRISGTGRANTALQAPLLDTATATALAIGTTNATAINLNQNTVVAATKTLTVTSGATTLTGATTGDALTVSNSTSTGNIAIFKDDSTTVASIANGGEATFQNSANSTSAFRVLNASGSSLFSIDSTNGGIASLLGMNSGETGSWNSAATTLTGTRAYAGTAIANGYVYVIGGNSTTTAQSTVYYAKINSDGTTGSWTTNTYALPVATAYTTATAQNGYLYVLGGSNSGGAEQATVYFARLNSDGSTGSWYTTTVLPAARSNGSAFSVNGYMYYIGGQNSSDVAQNTTYYSRINSDGTLGSWTAGSTITSPRKAAQVATANGYVYVAGGVDDAGSYQASVYYAALNPGTGAIGTFASTGSLPGTRAEGSALVANGYMYVIGGRDTSTYQTSVYYSKLSGSDGTAGAWATATNVLPAARGGRSTFVANGYLYGIGGYNGSDTTAAIYSASVARVQIGASLDLVSLQTANTTTSGSTTQGSTGGSITAGNGTFIGNMQVQGMTNLSQGLNVNGITTLEGNTYVAGTLSLSSTLAAYEGFENVTFPPSGGTGTWTTGGNANWARSTTHYNEGLASAASGTIADSQSSWLDVDYTWSQAGSITFEWDVSSEAGWDYLVVCVDKDLTCTRDTDYTYRISGIGGGWQQINIPMTAGAHSIRWLYGKDNLTAAGSDKGWVDNVRFNGGEGKITGNGINFSPATGYNITIGDNDSTAALFVLDRYNGVSDPAGTNGGMYYSTSKSKFRCYEANGWHDCAGGNIGYSEVTSTQGGITAAVDLTGFTTDVVVPSNHLVRVSAELSFTSTVAGDAPGIYFYEDSAAVYTCNIHLVKANEGDVIKCDVILAPTPGAHTYKLKGYRAGGSGTVSTNVASGAPGYIMVEDIGQ